MCQWHRNIQRMIDEIDACIRREDDEASTLSRLAGKLGYSESYVSRKFRELSGMRLREYLCGRRLAFALRDLRCGGNGILDIALKYVEFAIKAATNSLQFEEIQNFTDAMMLQRYTAVFGHLAYSLGEYQTAMLDFAEKTDGNEADRTAEGFAKMFGSYFPPEFSITEGNAWMSTLNNSVQYVSVIRPGEKVAKLVKRMHYVSFVGMFRSDLFEGLCVGHAPKKCKICGKWFLTTNARHTKYCGGYAPGDKLHRTCRQIGNLKGREQRELADDHPVKQIYEKRLNTINRYVKRGTLDADLAEVMKKLAKDKMLRALSNVAYAKGAYEKEMDQAALKKEASAKIYKERVKHE